MSLHVTAILYEHRSNGCIDDGLLPNRFQNSLIKSDLLSLTSLNHIRRWRRETRKSKTIENEQCNDYVMNRNFCFKRSARFIA